MLQVPRGPASRAPEPASLPELIKECPVSIPAESTTPIWLSALVLWMASAGAVADDVYSPRIAPASDEGQRALQRFRIPSPLQGELFASEPQLANPVAFGIDEQGRVLVAETFRQQKGVEDNRGHGHWLIDDLAAQTVADRIAYFHKHLKGDVVKYTREHDRIRLLEDTDGDGRADRSTVFADGFNAIEDGTGAGVLSIDGTVFYTCIPKLWTLRDRDHDGRADERTALYDGFGVRVAFRGHDMHGLVLGPDGRLYFSIGDRGYNVETPQGRLARPEQGAVFRCNLDGTGLEEFAIGLRNPQELAFDEFGNLFTGDNNSDGGDRARWVYVVEGGDSGWRMYYQYLSDRGPWNREKLWHPSHPGQAAYIVPPILNLADGPSGLTYYPGTGLDEKYRGHFFLADFRGSPANSGIRSFTLKPKGASFEVANAHEFLWSILATDVDFGYDGNLYVSDWVDGWDGSGKGRIYRFRDEKNAALPAAAEVASLMKAGFTPRETSELVKLLSHADSRIRQRAQFALAARGATAELTAVAHQPDPLLARIHAIWGLGQIARKTPGALAPVLDLVDDPNPEIRAQLARVCGETALSAGDAVLVRLCRDPEPRVQSLTAIAAGKRKIKAAVEALFEILVQNADADPTLRHAAVMGLVGAATPEILIAARQRSTVAERLGAVVALRRLAHPGIAGFLNDPEPLVTLEAARAIHDVPILEAWPALASLITLPAQSDPLLRRTLNANYRQGTAENARAVAAVAANASVGDAVRLEAIGELLDWNKPGPLDRVLNDYRPLPARDVDLASVIRPTLGALFTGSAKVREQAARLAAVYGIKDVEPLLAQIAGETDNSSVERVAAFQALSTLKSPHLKELVEAALADKEPSVRSEARRLLVEFDAGRAVTLLGELMDSTSIEEQQSAIATLTRINRPDADAVLQTWFDRMLEGQVAAALHLDLLEAARSRGKGFADRLRSFESRRNPDDHLGGYRESLAGGNAARGAEIFFGKAEVSCRRCHKVDGNGGDVGPDLSRIGLDKAREYLLESLVDPNRQIAKGFETVILQMESGQVHAGIIKSDDGQTLVLQKPDATTVTVKKAEIEDRAVGKSGMPEDLIKKLNKSELRDLVEYLSTRRNTTAPSGHGH